MVSFNIFNLFKKNQVTDGKEKISVDDLPNRSNYAYAGQNYQSSWQHSIFDGEKFFGGYGATQIYQTDYWTLRARSRELFSTKLYARGLIRRLITNEIGTGLMPEARPEEGILGLSDEYLSEWTDTVENRFSIWAENPNLCDYYGQMTFGELQAQARMEALINGDILVVNRLNKVGLPSVQIVSGDKVRSPDLSNDNKMPDGHYTKHGVEFNKQGKIVAYWIYDSDSAKYERLPAYGNKSKRRVAWLVYGTEKLMDNVRGEPLLSLIMQSLKEIDRYRDSTQRKAVNNSLLAGFVEKTQDKPSSLPLSGGAVRSDSATVIDANGNSKDLKMSQFIPGMFVEQLQAGESIKLMNGDGTDLNFGTFEEAILRGISFGYEIPPEIYFLSFSNNFSASAAAINEFKMYLEKIRAKFGDNFCKQIYVDWLIAETLLKKINAIGFLSAWRNPVLYDVFGAWTAVDWYGSIKPSTDMLKQVKASKMLIDNGLSTFSREARHLTGTKFSRNIKRLSKEVKDKINRVDSQYAEFENLHNQQEKNVDNVVENPTS